MSTAAQQRWYKTNRTRLRRLGDKWYRKNRTRLLAESKTQYPKKSARMLEVQRATYAKAKLETLAHYGPKGRLQCSWSGCSIVDSDMLTLDHINNDGAKERATDQHVCNYQRLRKNDFPAGYQTLCCNHQWKKEVERRRERIKKGTS